MSSPIDSPLFSKDKNHFLLPFVGWKIPHWVVPWMIFGASFFFVYLKTIQHLVHDWSNDPNYSHGFLIPLISAYMIWMKKYELTAVGKPFGHWGLGIIIAGVLLNILGNVGAELFIMRFSMLVTIWGAVWYLMGAQSGKIILIPLVYLLFMIPIPAIIWNKLAFPLQLMAAKLTAVVVQGIGIPIYREGNILNLANTSLEVVDACSGLRSLTSLLALSAAFAYISQLNNRSRWILFFSAIPIAIIVNIVRLTVTAVMAKYWGAEAAHGFLHDMSGMVIFTLALALLYAVFKFMESVELRLIQDD